MTFKYITFLLSAKDVIMDHVGNTVSLSGQKKHKKKTYHQVTWVIRPFLPRADMGVSG